MNTQTRQLVSVAAFVFFSAAIAQSLGLESALKQAFTNGPDLASSLATLENARADLRSKEADPSTLIVQLTQARNAVALNAAQLEAQKIAVLQNVTGAYISLFEAQENIRVLESSLALDQRNLDVAKAKLAAKNGTQLDVAKAENALASSKQTLSDARANLPILSNKLEPLLGLTLSGNLSVVAPPAFKEVKFDLTTLEKGLESRLPNVLQTAQNVELQQLNVRLADNDYTPAATLRDAKTNLENAQRNLETGRKNALTSLRDAARSVSNALERVRLADIDLDNAKISLEQDQAKFKSGTISRLQLQQTEVQTTRSAFSYTQATDAYLRALTQLSSAAGRDVTGLIAKAGGGQ